MGDMENVENLMRLVKERNKVETEIMPSYSLSSKEVTKDVISTARHKVNEIKKTYPKRMWGNG